MRFHWIENEINYDGSQLRSHWIRETTGIEGDAIVAFVGPCNVAPEHMVDLEDRTAGSVIRAKKMLHFIVECFSVNIFEAVLLQRLLTADALEELRIFMPDLRREGDDLYKGERKLSVSIATVSPVSGLIHLGINIDAEGAPVPAAQIPENVDIKQLAEKIGKRFCEEFESARRSTWKVKWVR